MANLACCLEPTAKFGSVLADFLTVFLETGKKWKMLSDHWPIVCRLREVSQPFVTS